MEQQRAQDLIASRGGDTEPQDFSPIAAGSKRLLGLLQSDGNPEVRAAAAYQLAAAPGTDVSVALLAAIDDRSPLVSLRAIRSLAERHERSVLSELRVKLERNADPNLRAALRAAIESGERADAIAEDHRSSTDRP